MKAIKGLIFITLVLTFFTGMTSVVLAGVGEPPPPPLPSVQVTEWTTLLDPIEGQYSIEISSNGPNSNGDEWVISWFAVENPGALSSSTLRPDWFSSIGTMNEVNDFLDTYVDIFGNSYNGPLAESNVVGYFNDGGAGENIGPNEYSDLFYWSSSLPPASHYWAGLTLINSLPGGDIPELTLVHGEAVNLDQQPIPEPATLFLLGTGLAGVGAIRRKRAKKS